MRDNYDFSKGERGKFYRPGTRTVVAVHLDPDVQDFFRKRAVERGVTMDELVNTMLRKDMEMIEAAE